MSLLILISSLSGFGYTQSANWAKVYRLNAPSRGVAVKELNSGHYIIGAEYTSINQLPNRMILFKTDEKGDSLNSIILCGSVTGDIELNPTKDEVVIVGTASSCIPNVQSDIVYYRLDTAFNLIDTALFGNSGLDKGKRIITDYDSGYVMACYNTSYPDLLNFDKNGNTIWSKSYGLSGLTSIKRNLEGGYFICGNAGGGFVDPMYVANIDSLGNVIWYKTFYNPNSEIFTDIEPTPDSGVIAVTDFNGLYKISATGDSVWKKTMNGPSQRLITNSDGDILIIGGGMRLTKVDTSGTILWSYTYWIYPVVVGVLSYDGWDVIQTSDGGYLLVGEIDSLGTKNLYVVKTDSLGQVTTGLSEINPSAQTQCYPQPFTEETIITFTAADGLPISGNHTLEVFTTQGQKVREETIYNFPFHFHRNRLPSGLYVYTITHPGEIPVTGKMVVE